MCGFGLCDVVALRATQVCAIAASGYLALWVVAGVSRMILIFCGYPPACVGYRAG